MGIDQRRNQLVASRRLRYKSSASGGATRRPAQHGGQNALQTLEVGYLRGGVARVFPSIAVAQATGLAGVVKDNTGGVLPGVSVEAASPALIERVRTVTTDEQGSTRSSISGPALYKITFTLPGFASVVREGIDLPAGFTATVNAELRVGGVEETITVSGQSPTVDVQNVRRADGALEQCARQSSQPTISQSFVPYIPGVVGGLGDIGRDTALLAIHGGRTGEANVAIDGANDHTFEASGGGAGFTYYINQGSVQEVTVTTGAQSAEQAVSGITTNLDAQRRRQHRFPASWFSRTRTRTCRRTT